MPKVARKGDTFSTGHGCTTTSTLDSPGQSTVFANDILICRTGDPSVSHTHSPPACPEHVVNIIGGSPNVFVVGSNIADIGDAIDAGSITGGSPTVFANGAPEE